WGGFPAPGRAPAFNRSLSATAETLLANCYPLFIGQAMPQAPHFLAGGQQLVEAADRLDFAVFHQHNPVGQAQSRPAMRHHQRGGTKKAPGSSTRAPFQNTWPALGGSSPMSARTKVDLPEPIRPVTTTSSPRQISREAFVMPWVDPGY